MDAIYSNDASNSNGISKSPAAPATAVAATIIGMPAVQTARTPVTVGSLARPPGTAGLLTKQGSCNSRTLVTAELLQQPVLTQQGPCNSRATATAGHLQHQEACNSRNDRSNSKDASNKGKLAWPSATAGLLQQQGTFKSRKLAKVKSLQQQRCQ
jgi:hypothetical protein